MVLPEFAYAAPSCGAVASTWGQPVTPEHRPNAVVADVHRRMPAILKRDDYQTWLDPDIKNPSLASRCLEPFDAALMKKYPVSVRVNRPENDDRECAQEISVATTPMLF